MKEALVTLAAATTGGATATDADRAEAAALLALLEAAAEPTGTWAQRADLIEGTWEQIWTDNPQSGTVWGNGRSSRRKLKGPISGRVVQIIKREIEPVRMRTSNSRSRLSVYALRSPCILSPPVAAAPV